MKMNLVLMKTEIQYIKALIQRRTIVSEYLSEMMKEMKKDCLFIY